MSVNKVILVGRLGAEPESRAFPNGGSICNLRVATTESWKNKQTGQREERVEWHRITLTNRLGEIAQQYLHKGSQIYIEGRIQTRKWQDAQGQDKYSTEIVGDSMTMLDTKGGGAGSGSNNNPDAYNPPRPASPSAGADYGDQQDGADYLDDDVPF